jgi:hypothetical protein
MRKVEGLQCHKVIMEVADKLQIWTLMGIIASHLMEIPINVT